MPIAVFLQNINGDKKGAVVSAEGRLNQTTAHGQSELPPIAIR